VDVSGAEASAVRAAGASEKPTAAGELLRAVASHDLDPYAAADVILGSLIGGGSTL
jgi:hypothetical protein